MTKQEARAQAKRAINLMSDAEREWASDAIIDCLTGVDAFRRSKSAFIYLNDGEEPDTHELVGLALAMERTVSVPRVRGGDMQAIVITPYSNFKRNRWGILEPDRGIEVFDSELAVIPMRAFDGMSRLGRGKGYYDRYLQNKECFKIGIAFECQFIEGLPVEEHDALMDMVVTEKYIRYKDGRREQNPYCE